MAQNNLSGKYIKGMVAAIMFFIGFFFVDRASFTGNVVLDGQPSFNPLAIIGLLFVLCASVLAIYAIRNR